MAYDDILERLAGFGYGEHVELAVADLEVPKEFQRKLTPRNWAKFIPAIFGRASIAEVTSAGGKKLAKPRLVIVNGQHRVHEAARFGIKQVPCLLWKDMSLEDVAAIFALDNSTAVSLSPQVEFRAACIALDPDALELDAALLDRGLDGWPLEEGQKVGRAPQSMRAISSVRKLQKEPWGGLDHALYTLDVIRDIWPWPTEDDSGKAVVWSESPHVRTIRGFGQFLRPEKRVQKSARSKVTVTRRWNPADRELLVEAMRTLYTTPDALGLNSSGLDTFVALSEREGPGGGGGSLGMELVLRKVLNKARYVRNQEAKAAEKKAA